MALALTAGGTFAQDRIIVGKSVGNSLAFTPVDIGIEKGIWAKHGLELEVQVYGGEARLQQALISNATDFALGSGPGMGFLARGVEATTIGVIANEPLSMGLIVSDVENREDLRGKRIGITTNGSLTFWLAREFSRQMGWGVDGLQPVAVGALPAQIAALRSGQTDGFIMSSSSGYVLEKEGQAKVLLEFGELVPKFLTHVIFATNRVVEDRPDVVRRFLAGWQETVDWMFDNREEAVALAMNVTGLPEDVALREYDVVMPMMSRDMRFDAEALDVVANSIVEMELTTELPDMSQLYTEEFLPAVR